MSSDFLERITKLIKGVDQLTQNLDANGLRVIISFLEGKLKLSTSLDASPLFNSPSVPSFQESHMTPKATVVEQNQPAKQAQPSPIGSSQSKWGNVPNVHLPPNVQTEQKVLPPAVYVTKVTKGKKTVNKKNNNGQKPLPPLADGKVRVSHERVHEAINNGEDRVEQFCGSDKCGCCYYFRDTDERLDLVRKRPSMIHPYQLYVSFGNMPSFEGLGAAEVESKLRNVLGEAKIRNIFVREEGFAFVHFDDHFEAGEAQVKFEKENFTTNFVTHKPQKQQNQQGDQQEAHENEQ